MINLKVVFDCFDGCVVKSNLYKSYMSTTRMGEFSELVVKLVWIIRLLIDFGIDCYRSVI